MAQKALAPEKVEQAQELRKQGLSISQIAQEVGISEGSASNATRGIPKPVARAPVVKKEASKRVAEGNSLRITGKVPPAEATIRAINEADQAEALTRKAIAQLAYQTALGEIEDRKQERKRAFDLEVKRQEAEIKESETRAKLVTSPSPELTLQLEAAKSETARAERDLAELRHSQRLDELSRGFQGQYELLSRQIATINRTGLTSYDLISQGMSKLENMAMVAGSKVDSFLRDNRSDKQLGMALSLGLSPGEYEVLVRGPETPFTKAQWQALVGGDSLTPSDIAGYERHLASTEQRNVHYEAVMAKTTQKLGQGGASGAGKLPAPEPVKAIKGEVVVCPGCGCQVQVDLSSEQFAGAMAAKAKGEVVKVSGHCPQCNGSIDLSNLFKSEKPKELIKYE